MNNHPKKVKVKKHWYHWSNILFYILLAFIFAMLINPDFKGKTLATLMKTGLFSPSIPSWTKEERKVYKKVMDFKVSNQEGHIIELRDLKGKVIFINFWAEWCPPCKAEMPSLQKLYEYFEDHQDVVFLMVNADYKGPASLKYILDRGFTFPVVYPRSALPTIIFKGTLPTTVVLDKRGGVAFEKEGLGDFSSKKFIKFIEQLLSE